MQNKFNEYIVDLSTTHCIVIEIIIMIIFSGKVQYEESSSRPPSGRTRLTPIENAPEIPEEAYVPEPPSTVCWNGL